MEEISMSETGPARDATALYYVTGWLFASLIAKGLLTKGDILGFLAFTETSPNVATIDQIDPDALAAAKGFLTAILDHFPNQA
jgi:hypothetical protein